LKIWMTLVLVSGVAFAQGEKPSVAGAPLQIDPSPALTKVEKELQAEWFRLLIGNSGAIVPSRKEAEVAMADTKRLDFRESDEALAKFAEKAGTLYAVYASLQYTLKKQVVLTGRVVRDDGKLIKTARVELAKGEDTIPGIFPVLADRFFLELGLKTLPTFKEVAPPVKDPVKDPVKVEVKDPLPPLPPIVPIDTGKGQRTAGMAVLIGGAAVAAVGGVLMGAGCGLGCGVTPDDKGNISNDELNRVVPGRTLMTIGVTSLAIGAGAAALGAILLATAAPEPVKQLGVVPIEGGAVVQFGGTF
jgi:hypothetical protein